MTQQATLATRAWSIDGFRAFWSRPDPALIPRVLEVVTDDIVGYWPRPIGEVRGAKRYLSVIAAIAEACPDLSLTAPEYATSGDLHFVRWVANGAGGRLRFTGLDRLRVGPDGRVCENYVFCDHPFFAQVAELVRRP